MHVIYCYFERSILFMRKKTFKARKVWACSLALSLVIATPITPPHSSC